MRFSVLVITLILGVLASVPLPNGDGRLERGPASVIPGRSSSQREYVNSQEDFLFLHMASHIERVEKLGMALCRISPGDCQGLDPDLLARLLRVHDRSKFDPDISSALYANYARNFSADSPEKAKVLALVDELNRRDTAIGVSLFRSYQGRSRSLVRRDGSFTALAERYLRIERVADKVDRALAEVSVEEFGRKMTAASEFMKDPNDQRLARELEKAGVYERITAGATFGDYRARRAFGGCDQAYRRVAALAQ